MDVEGMIDADESALLYRLAVQAQGAIVEIGSYRGLSTIVLAFGARAGAGGPVYAIDPHEEFTEPSGFHFGHEDAAVFMRNMLNAKVADVVRMVQLPAGAVALNIPIGLLWIDGNHEQALDDARQFIWQVASGGRIAFHDTPLPGVRAAIAFSESAGFQQVETVGGITVLEWPIDD